MKAYVVHLKNKYPDCIVRSTDSSLDVHAQDGTHVIALRTNAHGQMIDMHEEYGTEEKFDLSPIPKESRAFKLYANGMIGKSEEHEDRKAWSKKNASNRGSYHKVLAIGEVDTNLPTDADEASSNEVKPAKKARAKK